MSLAENPETPAETVASTGPEDDARRLLTRIATATPDALRALAVMPHLSRAVPNDRHALRALRDDVHALHRLLTRERNHG